MIVRVREESGRVTVITSPVGVPVPGPQGPQGVPGEVTQAALDALRDATRTIHEPIALAVVDLEAVANELLRISNASATHRTIVDNVIEGWSNRGAA